MRVAETTDALAAPRRESVRLEKAGLLPPANIHWRIKAIVGGSIGNLIEWYDWFVYSSFALYFAGVFFPKGDQTAQLLNSAAIFAVGFLMRPIGSWLLGIYADRHGRRAALVVSMLLMSAASLVAAVVPGYATIGIFAPAILLLSRIAQGISLGAEYGTVATYLSEVAGNERRGFLASFQYVTMIVGQLLAMLVLIVLQNILTDEQLVAWGWRIPFAIGAAGAVVALWIRRGLAESEAFVALQKRGRSFSSWQMMAQYPREILIVLGLTVGGTVGFYTYGTYMQKFLVNTSGFSRDTATLITALAMVVWLLAQPVFGWISDIVGRKPLLIAYGGLGALSTIPILSTLANTHVALNAFLLVSLALIIQTAYTSIAGLFKAELFPTEIRALGVGLPYAIVVSAVGGTAEFVALALKQAGHETWFYGYVTVLMTVSLMTALCMRDTKRHSRIVADEKALGDERQ